MKILRLAHHSPLTTHHSKWLIFTLLLALSFLCAGTFAATARFKPFIERFPEGRVDWDAGYFYGTGVGYPHLNDGSKAKAMKVAEAKALSAILQVASGLRVDDRRTLADLEREKTVIQLRALIRYEPHEQQFVQEGKPPFYRVTYRAPMKGVQGLTRNLLPHVGSGRPVGGDTIPKPSEDNDEGATWLVLDARGLSKTSPVQPALFPKILTEKGDAVFDLNVAEEGALVQKGMARYVVSDKSREEIDVQAGAGRPGESCTPARPVLGPGPGKGGAQASGQGHRQGCEPGPGSHEDQPGHQRGGCQGDQGRGCLQPDSEEVPGHRGRIQLPRRRRGWTPPEVLPFPTDPMEPQKRLFRSYVVFSCLITVLLIVLVFFSHRMKFLDRAELYLYDLHFLWRGAQPTSGNTVLVLMDQKSATALERRKGAWSRAQVAGAVRNLCGAGAAVIGLDMVFFAPGQDPEEDDALASALDHCGNVVLARFVAEEGRAEISALPRFQDAMLGDGFINMFPDLDGVVRRVPFFSVKPAGEGVAVSPSFSLELVRAFLNLDFVLDFSQKESFRMGGEDAQKVVLPYPDLRIHYYGGAGAFSRLSFAEVVQNRFNPETVKGRIVLLGSSLATDKDFFATPLSRAAGKAGQYREKFGRVVEEGSATKTEGVAVHAMAVETMLNRAFIGRVPTAWVVSLTVLLGILGLIFYLQRPGPLAGLLILLCLSGCPRRGRSPRVRSPPRLDGDRPAARDPLPSIRERHRAATGLQQEKDEARDQPVREVRVEGRGDGHPEGEYRREPWRAPPAR